MKKFLLILLLIIAISVLGFSAYNIFKITNEYQKSDELNEQLTVYRPGSGGDLATLRKAKEECNADTSGWITIDGTNIDYMVVQGTDNQYYLTHGVNGEYLASGSIFIDYRNSADFSDFNTVIYGHQMNNGSMFEDLRKYRDESYFNSHLTGKIFSLERAMNVEFFAFMVTDSASLVYDVQFEDDFDKLEHLENIRNNATWYRELELDEFDHIITLSTCTYEFENARAVLIGKIVD